MKFGKEFSSQLVHEWEDAYMNYNNLKKTLKSINKSQRNEKLMAETSRAGGLKRRISLYRAFSGLTPHHNCCSSSRDSPKKGDDEEEVVLVTPLTEEGIDRCRATFMMWSEDGCDSEVLFCRELDFEFNKALNFYRKKVGEVLIEAEGLNRQMDALIALRLKVEDPVLPTSVLSFASDEGPINGRPQMDAISEVEMSKGNSNDADREGNEEKICASTKMGNGRNVEVNGFKPASLDILNYVKINVDPQTPVSTIKAILPSSGLSLTKVELKRAEQQMTQAFVEFHRKLRYLKRYSFLNQLGFSKIMKKYDKITSRNASKAYLEMVDKSDLGSSDVVNKLIERVEAAFIKHFANGNRRKGMKSLRPVAKKDKHRVTFFMGLLFGCAIALSVAIGVLVHVRDIYESEGRGQYMENIFPLYSMYGFIVLHMLVYAGDIYFWKRYRVNYPFIFGFKQGTELSYREVLLLGSGLALLTLSGVVSNLDMQMNPHTKSFEALTELVPLAILTVLLLIIFCPFNIIYRSSRFFLIRCTFHCIAAPFYKVILPDFFLADQFTSQVQALRNFEFYICYYGWGDFTKRSNSCRESAVFKTFTYIIAIVPYWIRFIQSIRRLFEEKDIMHGLNGLKYLSTVMAVVMKTTFELNKGTTLLILTAVTSGVATIGNTYWDIVIDWGLLRKDSKNPWLRDKLAVPQKSVYFLAMVLNVVLRLAWMQTVLGITELPFLHNKALVAIVASLEIIRRGIWNFFRLENEHLNNVGKYRAFKSVPLPFNYKDEDKSL